MARFLIPGWLDRPAFLDAMSPAPCGCARIEEAKKLRDKTERALKELDAIEERSAWRCPNYTNRPPPERIDDIGPDQREALRAVEDLTGCDGCTTCPRWYAGLPWVVEAVEAYGDSERGELLIEHPMPSAVLMEAIRLVRRGVNERERYEHEQRIRELEEQAKNK